MKWLGALLGLGYPFLVLAALQWWEPRWVALGAALLFLLRGVTRGGLPRSEDFRPLLLPFAMVAAVILGTLLWNDQRALLLLPVAINAALLIAFGRTLRRGPSMIETFARLQDPELSPAQVAHCRLFTLLWCGFFGLSGALSGVLALQDRLWAWTAYTGFGAYLGMGVLFGLEVAVRAWRFGRYGDSVFAPLLRRLFPGREREHEAES